MMPDALARAREVTEDWLNSSNDEDTAERLMIHKKAAPRLVGRIVIALRAYGDARERAFAIVWDAFVKQIDDWAIEIEAEPIYEAAVKAGLMELAPYDPKKHGETDAEIGDLIYILTEQGKAIRARAEKA